jgi:hypothetical protein
MNVKSKSSFWRYGPEIIESDISIFACCEWKSCVLCDIERRQKCDRIRDIIKEENRPIDGI